MHMENPLQVLLCLLVGCALFVRAGNMESEYLCRATVPDDKMVVFLPMSDIRSEQDAVDWMKWAERTYPDYSGKMIPKWDREDPVAMKLELGALASVFQAGDEAVSPDGKMSFSVIGTADDGKVSLSPDETSTEIKNGFSPRVCATNVWVLSWQKLLERWNRKVEDEKFGDILDDIFTITNNSGRLTMAGGDVWKNRMDTFVQEKLAWPKWGIMNGMPMNVNVKVRYVVLGSESVRNFKMEERERQGFSSRTESYNHISKIVYVVEVDAAGYEHFRKNVTLVRGKPSLDDIVIELTPKKAVPPPPPPSPPPVKAEKKSEDSSRLTHVATRDNAVEAQSLRQPAQPSETAASKADEPNAKPEPKPVAPPPKPVPEWPEKIEAVLNAITRCIKSAIQRYPDPVKKEDEKNISSNYSKHVDVVKQSVTHIKECPGCDKCAKYQGQEHATIITDDEKYDYFIWMLFVNLGESVGNKKVTPDFIDGLLRQILKPDFTKTFAEKKNVLLNGCAEKFGHLWKNENDSRECADKLRKLLDNALFKSFCYHLSVCQGCDVCREFSRCQGYLSRGNRLKVLANVIFKGFEKEQVPNKPLSVENVIKTLNKFDVGK